MKSLALASLLALACSFPVRAESVTVEVPCGPLANLPEASAYRALSRDEWLVARATFFLAPNTPAALPPGDKAMLRELEDGQGVLVFVDGDEACAPLRVSKDVVDMLRQVKAAVVTHPAGGL